MTCIGSYADQWSPWADQWSPWETFTLRLFDSFRGSEAFVVERYHRRWLSLVLHTKCLQCVQSNVLFREMACGADFYTFSERGQTVTERWQWFLARWTTGYSIRKYQCYCFSSLADIVVWFKMCGSWLMANFVQKDDQSQCSVRGGEGWDSHTVCIKT